MAKLDETLTMLKDLTDARGIPGNEKEARDVMEKYITPYADEVFTDNLGSLIAKKTGNENGPKIMVAGHLDEVGFMVTRIDDKGFVYFQTVGGWWSQVMLAQRVTIMGKNGDVTGVIGSKPPHILSPEARKKPVDIKDMFIDIGASSKEEAEDFGVKPGDSIVPYFEFTQLKNEKMLLAKAWDNRIGCAIAIEVLKQLKDVDHPNIVYGVGTIQEEVGLRGARTSTHKIKPDIGFGVDVGIAGDTPGISDHEADSKLGKGPQIILYDASMISHKGVRDLVVNTADENNIPYQYASMAGGGTDSGSIHLTANGVPSLSITVATRYIHSHAAILHRDDFENAVKLIVETIKKLDANTVKDIVLA
ncbi:M42 family metallopeptidase [Virgibacillus halodenitrificans]|jgi:putative aminopeptidase FrvX|uniref:M42 family metallopeptidase n=1 Tax=Virgibacillus halodenitrificans TaxID=1482 RepID=A0AAC9NKY0_VIRHA|nr:M42 family metallopeptidase [Virgibacillus halodenitrificans]APC48071.1 peptidase M28 [Virgibacillus halodenitrificans]MBD1223704.1 M42 family metallopeptidase [Virgibacillus halodenitrificans]MCG1027843.1 M42 family metallopeptidase [Virgibacillus halodenitrificans]MCJ0931703.1 M42 family metallopeptidase [Virgibacillus halodenitrificans]MEC2159898.1 M42 family metallopeptidase [Virgibacillus halodenitrificans]